MNIYKHIISSKANSKKLFAILIDPDKQSEKELIQVIEKAKLSKTDFFLVGFITISLFS